MTTPLILTSPSSAPPRSAKNAPALLFLLTVLWSWALVICSTFWSHDDNYSYGFIVPFLVVIYLWRRWGIQPESFWKEISEKSGFEKCWHPALIALPALALFPIEVYRNEYHQSGIVLWFINGAAVGGTLTALAWVGGVRLLRLSLFPLLLFLTAVPWPDRIAHPLQQSLMIGVAQVVAEILLWLGIPVETMSGAVLKLSRGAVGIVEACSGIRSLQSGLMLSLAIGELLLLTPIQRLGLTCVTTFFALISNLIRTLILCWIMEKSGSEAVDKAHDWVGNSAMYSFYLAIWVVGKKFSKGSLAGDQWPSGSGAKWGSRFGALRWDRVPDLRPLLGIVMACLIGAHTWYWILARQALPQTIPYFIARLETGSGVQKIPFNEQAWRQLKAHSGESLKLTSASAPLGFVEAYHLFWKPSPESKLALGHRPDSCMPGSGWKQVGGVQKTNIVIDGIDLTFHVFRFERADINILQLWGVWRNGKPIELSYSAGYTPNPEVYRPWPTDRHLLGVELVSCLIAFPPNTQEPSIDFGAQSLSKLFHYRQSP